MKKKNSNRRDFLKFPAMSLGGLTLAPAFASANDISDTGTADSGIEKKLNILCIGGHPGDPEFGCGGTLLKYSDKGHLVTILYLSWGEGWAGDPALSADQAAAIRSREAETSCKILNARPLFAIQIDGNTAFNRIRSVEMNQMILSVNPDIVFTQCPLTPILI
jgi:LmbE family N-acetylglucosaminyl deacetylase